jgi:hypothetical protein
MIGIEFRILSLLSGLAAGQLAGLELPSEMRSVKENRVRP